MKDWLLTNWQAASLVVASTLCLYAVVMVCVRVVGLRSLAKMSPTDFLWTVATGSLLATSIVSPTPSILLATTAFASIFLLQWLVAMARRCSRRFERIMSNEPVMLMDGGRVLEPNLARVNVSRDELRAKLREANVLSYKHVLAVVMETTGDISVLHSDDPTQCLDTDLVRGVRRGESAG